MSGGFCMKFCRKAAKPLKLVVLTSAVQTEVVWAPDLCSVNIDNNKTDQWHPGK